MNKRKGQRNRGTKEWKRDRRERKEENEEERREKERKVAERQLTPPHNYLFSTPTLICKRRLVPDSAPALSPDWQDYFWTCHFSGLTASHFGKTKPEQLSSHHHLALIIINFRKYSQDFGSMSFCLLSFCLLMKLKFWGCFHSTPLSSNLINGPKKLGC